MKIRMSIFALLSVLGGCTTMYPNSPLTADTTQEARCLAIRENTPLHERGTRSDPTTDATSGCSRALAYREQAAPTSSGLLSPVRSVFDAAYYE